MNQNFKNLSIMIPMSSSDKGFENLIWFVYFLHSSIWEQMLIVTEKKDDLTSKEML